MIRFLVCVFVAFTSFGCGDVMCVRNTECVMECGGEVMGVGCGSCPEGYFDVFECDRDTGSGTDTGTADTGAGDTSVGDTGAGDSGGPVACGTMTCGADQYCVIPCCGGAGRPCEPRESDGSCPVGTEENPACSAPNDCSPPACTPDPPFCEPDDACTDTDCPAPASCGGGDWSPETRTLSCLCA